MKNYIRKPQRYGWQWLKAGETVRHDDRFQGLDGQDFAVGAWEVGTASLGPSKYQPGVWVGVIRRNRKLRLPLGRPMVDREQRARITMRVHGRVQR